MSTHLTLMNKNKLADGTEVGAEEFLVRDWHVVGGMGRWFAVVKIAILAQPSRGAKNLTAWQIAREEAKPV